MSSRRPTDGVTLDGLQSSGNHGPGIWFDYENTHVTIRNCTSSGNLPTTPDASTRRSASTSN